MAQEAASFRMEMVAISSGFTADIVDSKPSTITNGELSFKVPIPLMPIIEIIGMFTKPFSLMVRLFANILAGHFMILGVVAVIFLTAKMGMAVNGGLTVVAVILGVFMDCLEILVAFIQAYVFTMLSAVFIGLSRQKAETN